MHYNFIEIGTSDFETIIQNANDLVVGASIEPIKFYLDKLPSPKNVKKLNCAVSLDNTNRMSKVYYVTPEDIERNKLPSWLRGCNSVDDYHYQHEKLNIKHLVKIDQIEQVPIISLFARLDVSSLDFLKIDVEGGDCKLLKHLYPALDVYKPKNIHFEANPVLTHPLEIEEILKIYVDFGYTIVSRIGDNVDLSLK
jgi:hypothetical protein